MGMEKPFLGKGTVKAKGLKCKNKENSRLMEWLKW
jgi:hypothetical protein